VVRRNSHSLAARTFALGAGSLVADCDMTTEWLSVVELGSDMVETAVVWRTEVLQSGRRIVKAAVLVWIEASAEAAVL